MAEHIEGNRMANSLPARMTVSRAAALAVTIMVLLSGCASKEPTAESLPAPSADYNYIVGPGDNLNIFVWRNPELSQSVPVRPDGKISVPLVEDLLAAGKTSTQLAREIEVVLSTYIKEPLVTVLVSGFQGVFSTQVRVLGEASRPTALPYSDNMTVLDVMIAVGGLTEFADGNKARLVRIVDGKSHQAVVRLEDLIKDGDISANVAMAPGDVIIIPEAWF
jgi:polysaccharide export outer membrane protein